MGARQPARRVAALLWAFFKQSSILSDNLTIDDPAKID
jgi:hypothetical protein